MTANVKKWIAISTAAALVILVAGWFLAVSPKRSAAADLRTQASAAEQSNQALTTQLAMLKAQAKDLPKQQAVLAAVAAKIPDNPAMPSLIRNLSAAADSANVELVSVSPTPPTPMATSGSGSAAPAAGAAAPASSTGMQQIQVAVNVVGSYFQVAEYLDRLEGLQRAFRVVSFTAAPGSNPVKPNSAQASADNGKVLTATITGLVFETPGSSASSSLTIGK